MPPTDNLPPWAYGHTTVFFDPGQERTRLRSDSRDHQAELLSRGQYAKLVFCLTSCLAGALMATKPIYRIIFHNQGNVIELYAHEVGQSSMYAFIEVSEIIFGERSKLVVDPSEEQLKSQFAGVKTTYLPLHAIVRIDEVDKEGNNKILGTWDAKGNVTPFPMPVTPPRSGD